MRGEPKRVPSTNTTDRGNIASDYDILEVDKGIVQIQVPNPIGITSVFYSIE